MVEGSVNCNPLEAAVRAIKQELSLPLLYAPLEKLMIILQQLRPHIEAGGYHLDRFDALLDGEVITTSRQPVFDGARALIERGHHPEELMCADQNGHLVFIATIGENARWTIEESDKGGLRKRPWRELPVEKAVSSRAVGPRTGEERSGGTMLA
jgi:hypothetical protein